MKHHLKPLSNSSLSKKEQNEFALLLHAAPTKQRTLLLSVVETHPELIGFIWDMYKTKQKAFMNRDMNAWERIIKKENDALLALQKISSLIKVNTKNRVKYIK